MIQSIDYLVKSISLEINGGDVEKVGCNKEKATGDNVPYSVIKNSLSYWAVVNHICNENVLP